MLFDQKGIPPSHKAKAIMTNLTIFKKTTSIAKKTYVSNIFQNIDLFSLLEKSS